MGYFTLYIGRPPPQLRGVVIMRQLRKCLTHAKISAGRIHPKDANAPVPYRCRINTDHIRHDPACEPCSRRDGPRRSLLVLERPGRSLGLREANTAVLGSSKLPCSSVTVRGDGDIRGGPCSRHVGSGDSRSSTLIVRVRP